MTKHSFFNLILIPMLTINSISFTMEQQLMQRGNAGKSDDQEIQAAISSRIVKTIKENPCQFCLESLEIDKGALVLPKCQHGLHSSCFYRLTQNQYSNCLVCRGPLEIYDNSGDNGEESSCCIRGIEKTASVLIAAIEHDKLLYTLVVKEFTDPTKSWHSIIERAQKVCVKCTDDHVTF